MLRGAHDDPRKLHALQGLLLPHLEAVLANPACDQPPQPNAAGMQWKAREQGVRHQLGARQ